MTHPDDLLTVDQAAALVNRAPATIRSWQHRGTLPVAGTTPSRQGSPNNTYRRGDVLAAAQTTGATNARARPRRATTGTWNPDTRLLTLREAAATAGVHVRTIRDWIDREYLCVHPAAGDELWFLESAVLDAERAARRADPRSRTKG